MTVLAAMLLAAAMLLTAAGPAHAPGLTADWRLADSEQQGWGAR